MREIKFRAWDKTENRMVYLNTGHDTLWFGKNGLGSYFNLQNGSGGDEYTLMQYTGLTDKAGKEIYEGDIVEWFFNNIPYRRVVEWHDDDAMFLPNDMQKEPLVEIIGNIYENKELLK